MSLATKYRPQEFEDVCSQKIIIKILKKQLELRKFSNIYLFCGKTGIGKTTLARIFSNKINNGQGTPIEIDAASNNGVDNIRAIITDAKERSLDSEYKIYILDEIHMLTTQAWNAFLKCLEEPPKYTIFICCTTDPQKIPSTIMNRMMRFNLTPIPDTDIELRLNKICELENFTSYKESTNYISKISDGSMRNAISYLEIISNYDNNIIIENTLNILGKYSYDLMFDLTNNILDLNNEKLLNTLNLIFNEGKDFKLFIDQYINFVLDLDKYCILKNINVTNIPKFMIDKLNYTVNIENNIKYFNFLLNKLLDLKDMIKTDTNIKSTITIKLLELIRGN